MFVYVDGSGSLKYRDEDYNWASIPTPTWNGYDGQYKSSKDPVGELNSAPTDSLYLPKHYLTYNSATPNTKDYIPGDYVTSSTHQFTLNDFSSIWLRFISNYSPAVYLAEPKLDSNNEYSSDGKTISASSIRLIRPLVVNRRQMLIQLINTTKFVISRMIYAGDMSNLFDILELYVMLPTKECDDMLQYLPKLFNTALRTKGVSNKDLERQIKYVYAALVRAMESPNWVESYGFVISNLEALKYTFTRAISTSSVEFSYLTGYAEPYASNSNRFDARYKQEYLMANHTLEVETILKQFSNIQHGSKQDLLFPDSKPIPITKLDYNELYLKALGEQGEAISGGHGIWNLPVTNADGSITPGDWMETIVGYIATCRNGYHMAKGIDILTWMGQNEPIHVYVGEYKSESPENFSADDKKMAGRDARLLRPVGIYDLISYVNWQFAVFEDYLSRMQNTGDMSEFNLEIAKQIATVKSFWKGKHDTEEALVLVDTLNKYWNECNRHNHDGYLFIINRLVDIVDNNLNIGGPNSFLQDACNQLTIDNCDSDLVADIVFKKFLIAIESRLKPTILPVRDASGRFTKRSNDTVGQNLTIESEDDNGEDNESDEEDVPF